jgi:transposase
MTNPVRCPPEITCISLLASESGHSRRERGEMHIRTLLNHVCKHQSFVYQGFSLTHTGGRDYLEVKVEPRKNSQPICSICGHPAPVHDRLAERRCEFVPLWNIPVIFLYCMRRVRCTRCHNVVVERVPWVEGKSQHTTYYALFLATWAKRMSWQEVARAFSTSWQSVYAAVIGISMRPHEEQQI